MGKSFLERKKALLRWRMAKITGNKKWIQKRNKKRAKVKLEEELQKTTIEFLDKAIRRLLALHLDNNEIEAISYAFDLFSESQRMDEEAFVRMCLSYRSENSVLDDNTIYIFLRMFEFSKVDSETITELDVSEAQRHENIDLKKDSKSIGLHELLLFFSFWKQSINTNENCRGTLYDFFFNLFTPNTDGKMSVEAFSCAIRVLVCALGMQIVESEIFDDYKSGEHPGVYIEEYDELNLVEKVRFEKKMEALKKSYENSHFMAKVDAFINILFNDIDIMNLGELVDEDLQEWLILNLETAKAWSGGVHSGKFLEIFREYAKDQSLKPDGFRVVAFDTQIFAHSLPKAVETKFVEYTVKLFAAIPKTTDSDGKPCITKEEFTRWMLMNTDNEFKLSCERVAGTLLYRIKQFEEISDTTLAILANISDMNRNINQKHSLINQMLETGPKARPRRKAKSLRTLLKIAPSKGVAFQTRIAAAELVV